MSTVNIETLSPTRKRLVVPVAAEDVVKAEAVVIKAVMAEANVPGFRVGKAPEAMVRSRYAATIADELQRRVVTESYQRAVKDAKLDLCAIVDIEAEPVAATRNTVVTVTVDLYPDFTLPSYKSLPVKLPKVQVEDKEVTATIDLIRGQRADFSPVERAAAAGDYVRLGYVGTLDGKLVSEIVPDRAIYGTQKSTWEEAGQHEYGIKAITEGIIGMQKGDKKTIVMNFDKSFEVAALAGKAVSYEVEVHEVRQKKMPELDENFFKSVGVKDLAELTEQIRKSLQARSQEENETAKRTQLSDALVAAVNCELPESLLTAETQQIADEIVDENRRRGVAEELIEKNRSEIIAKAKDAAQKRVKLRLVLRKVAEAEKIEVKEDDFQRYIMTESMQRQTSPDKILKELQSDRERMSNLAQALRLSKAMNVIVDAAKIEEVEKPAKK
jgi:trigger factor